ncbi:Protein FAM195A, partial [Myotis davidii]
PDSHRSPPPSSHSPGPRLVFNRVNGRRPPTTSPSTEATQETYTLAHEENVRFVSEAWQQVEQQLGGGPAGESSPRPVQYVERTPNPRLQNFVPIDLDEWWAQQFLARITNCS